MRQPEITVILILIAAVAFCLGWIAHAGALHRLQKQYERRAERLVFARMSPDERQKVVDQVERINALRPKRRRVTL